METPFRAMDFKKHDVVTIDDVNQMQANLQWLLENTPRGQFYAEKGPAIPNKTVIVSGRVYIARSKKQSSSVKNISFGRAFSPRCHPNVTTGLVAQNRRVFVSVNGPRSAVLPTASGFQLKALMAEPAGKKVKWKISQGFYVNWQAMGYREANQDGI